MNLKIIGLIFVLIMVISVIFFTAPVDNQLDISEDESEEGDTEDILNEIDESFLDEDDEIEIGEMV